MANYESVWWKWIDKSSRRLNDPFYCDINPVLDFLGELFQARYEFRAIGYYRSAISIFHRPISDSKVGIHPKVSELMKGVFNNKPSKPKYISIWAVQRVLDFIKESCSDNKKNSVKKIPCAIPSLGHQ